MALVCPSSSRLQEERVDTPPPSTEPPPPEREPSGATPQEESWRARLDEVFAKTGWPDA